MICSGLRMSSTRNAQNLKKSGRQAAIGESGGGGGGTGPGGNGGGPGKTVGTAGLAMPLPGIIDGTFTGDEAVDEADPTIVVGSDAID
mmetsp:Transcript_88288/g.234762  ORF Transcript_88288/g.234762 Transcript_88288/m.234762 type:complete len:88 (+) Transcript_88288:418-681(+)